MKPREIMEMAQLTVPPAWLDDRCKYLEAFAKLVEERTAAKEHEWLIGYIRTHQPSCEQMANAIRSRGEA